MKTRAVNFPFAGKNEILTVIRSDYEKNILIHHTKRKQT